MKRLQQVRLLYKSILKLHRAMPTELQALGNAYVRDEFKRHLKCSEDEARLFMNEWTDYALCLSQQLGDPYDPNFGKNLDPKIFDDLRDEQIAQLYELMKATKNKSPES